MTVNFIANGQSNLSLIHFACPSPESHCTGPDRFDDVLVGWEIHTSSDDETPFASRYAWPIGLRPTLVGDEFLCVIWDDAAPGGGRWYNPATGELHKAGPALFQYAQRKLDEYKEEMGICDGEKPAGFE